MNELLHHEDYVAAYPDDKTAALALVDHLTETCGWEYRYAVRTVAHIRYTARTARDVAAASARLAHNAYGREYLNVCIVLSLNLNADWPMLISVVPGSRPPSAVQLDYHTDGDHFPYWGITVGARWVLRLANQFDADVRDFHPAAANEWTVNNIR
jgi:hypothetical protein